MPIFAPFSGALSVRPKGVRNVFNIRASYADEAEQLVQHLATIKTLGADATGMAISQIVPLPGNLVMPVVRDFQQAWKAAQVAQEPSHLALEGYINARVFAVALRRTGRNPTRSGFIDSTWAIKNLDLGGFSVGFNESNLSASRFVELTMVSREGRFIR